MTMTTRRKLLAALAAAGIGATLAPGARADAGLPGDAGTLLDDLDPLLAQARAWLVTLLQGGEAVMPTPTARLQRRYRIGHARASSLADALVRAGAWTIHTDRAGERHARIHAVARR